jgi:hypothetical protein
MSELGLSPSDDSSGAWRRQGTSPKAGKTHARRALVEGAWADRDPAKVSRHLQLRLDRLPNPIQDLRWKAPIQLCQRYRQRSARGQPAHQVVVAMARDLITFRWAMAKEVPLIPYPPSPDWPRTESHRNINTPSEEVQPRYGATLAGVTRPLGTLVPRLRPAPDGDTSGGRQPTAIRRINRRM